MVQLQLYLFLMINSVSSFAGGGMGTLSVFECNFSPWCVVPYSGCNKSAVLERNVLQTGSVVVRFFKYIDKCKLFY